MSSRTAVLRLYRQCLLSAKRIPDADQRITYEAYVRNEFRSKRGLPRDSRQAKAAIANAEEQCSRMNYYHSIREAKQSRVVVDEEETISRDEEEHDALQEPIPQGNRPPDKKQVVQEWLQTMLPNLYPDDLETYSQHLIDEGFDSRQILEDELLEEDLSFIKTAHRRAILRSMKRQEKENGDSAE
jgi:hypothetical protein